MEQEGISNMSVSKFGHLLKEDCESDPRWADADKALKEGKKEKFISIVRGIFLSWSMSLDENFIKHRSF